MSLTYGNYHSKLIILFVYLQEGEDSLLQRARPHFYEGSEYFLRIHKKGYMNIPWQLLSSEKRPAYLRPVVLVVSISCDECKPCYICSAVLRDSNSYERHEQVHASGNLNQCPKCDAMCGSSKLEAHMTSIHKEATDTGFVCLLCDAV